MRAIRARLAGYVLMAALASVACGSGRGLEKPGTGVVRGIDPANARVTHDPRLLEGVEVGNEVDFRVRYADGRYTVTDIDPR